MADHLKNSNYSINEHATSNINSDIFILTPEMELNEEQINFLENNISDIEAGGYKIVKENKDIYLMGLTERACLYGIMDIIEQLGSSIEINKLEERQINPAFSFQAIKFNLPWSPYRPGPATDLHIETCKDLNFWESFLDMMKTDSMPSPYGIPIHFLI